MHSALQMIGFRGQGCYKEFSSFIWGDYKYVRVEKGRGES